MSRDLYELLLKEEIQLAVWKYLRKNPPSQKDAVTLFVSEAAVEAVKAYQDRIENSDGSKIVLD